MHDGLGVAAVPENVAKRDQLVADRRKIIYFSIKNDHDGAVFIVHRLLATGRINDRQAAMAQCNPRFGVQPLPVRAAMGDRIGHAFDQ